MGRPAIMLIWRKPCSRMLAAVKLNLAVVASAKRKTKLAKALLNECKRLDAKGVLKKDIKQVEAAIRSPQQMRMRGR